MARGSTRTRRSRWRARPRRAPAPRRTFWRRSRARGPAGRRTLFLVALLPFGEDAVAMLRGPVEVVRIDDLRDVLREPLRDREAGHRDGGEVLRVERHHLVADRPVEELLRRRVRLALLRQRVRL